MIAILLISINLYMVGSRQDEIGTRTHLPGHALQFALRDGDPKSGSLSET
jgi:hypothetical protein